MDELINLFEVFGELPGWLKSCSYLLVGSSLAGIGWLFSPVLALILGIGLLFVIVSLGIYYYVLKRGNQSRHAMLGVQLEQNTQATPSAIRDPSRRARLEDLRKRFQEGIDKFKAVGKDIYKLPWYVVIGAPGAGKSEAIRRSSVGFPPGMQDELQGVGGTINMNWWFTNHAVILDTAGRLIFEELVAGSTNEWIEFLKLLRKTRSNCPINGLLLFIPADSLILGGQEMVDQPARRIAQQLDRIQRELDIRFPVYVVISKCDLINGFRETFTRENLNDEDAQRQMLGWSNPAPIDTRFDPTAVDAHFQLVAERLRRRRLKLLEDPVSPQGPMARRTDEVDNLYDFPNAVQSIAANLRKYLSLIFVDSEWSPRPLFLRGIYFTSSLREGAELDQEIAKTFGVEASTLPQDKSWEREHALFLRDLFTEKIFRESGLVTRASNTLRLVRSRQIALFGTATVALLLLMLFSWLGYATMRDSIGHQSGYWLRASDGWANNEWMPIVSTGDQGFVYNGDKPVGAGADSGTKELFDGWNKSLIDFHGALRDITESDVHISPVFRPLAYFTGNMNAERRRAQRIVFEGSVVKPLVDAARKKIADSPAPSSDNPKAEMAALLSLVKLESGILKHQQHWDDKVAASDEILSPLQSYVVATDYSPVLADVGNWTYTKGDGSGKWPEGWLSGGNTLVKDQPGYNAAIDVGIEHFRQWSLQSLAGSDAKWKQLIDLVDYLKNSYAPKEQDLFHDGANAAGNVVQEFDSSLETPYAELSKVKGALDDRLRQSQTDGLFGENGPVTLEQAYDLILKNRKNQQTEVKSYIDAMLAEALSSSTQTGPPAPLMKEIQDRLNEISKQTQIELQGLDPSELKTLDDAYLVDDQGGGPVYAHRYALYKECLDTTKLSPKFESLIGNLGAALQTIVDSMAKAHQDVVAYQGPSKGDSETVCAYWLALAKKNEVAACCSAYLVEAKKEVDPALHFPLVWPPEDNALTVEQIKSAANLFDKIHHDVNASSDTFKSLPAESTAPLVAFDKQLSLLNPVIHGLISMDGNVASCSIAGPEGQAPVAPPAPPPAPVPVPVPAPGDTNAAPILPPAPPPAPPDISYELREWRTWPEVDQNHPVFSKINVLGHPDSYIENIPVDQKFHFHRRDGNIYANDYVNPNTGQPGKLVEPWLEVPCYFDWCAIRLLSQGTPAGDGTTWTVKVDVTHPDVTFIFTFQHPLPQLQQWPTRDAILSGN